MKKLMYCILGLACLLGLTACGAPMQSGSHTHVFEEETLAAADLYHRKLVYTGTCTSCGAEQTREVDAQNFRCNGFFLFTPEELETALKQRLSDDHAGWELTFTESRYDGQNSEGPIEECKIYTLSREDTHCTLVLYCATEQGQKLAARNGYVPVSPTRSVARLEVRLLQSHSGSLQPPELEQEDLDVLFPLIGLCKPEADAVTVIAGLLDSLGTKKDPQQYYCVDMDTYEDLYLLEAKQIRGTQTFDYYSCYLLPGNDKTT